MTRELERTKTDFTRQIFFFKWDSLAGSQLTSRTGGWLHTKTTCSYAPLRTIEPLSIDNNKVSRANVFRVLQGTKESPRRSRPQHYTLPVGHRPRTCTGKAILVVLVFTSTELADTTPPAPKSPGDTHRGERQSARQPNQSSMDHACTVQGMARRGHRPKAAATLAGWDVLRPVDMPPWGRAPARRGGVRLRTPEDLPHVTFPRSTRLPHRMHGGHQPAAAARAPQRQEG